MELLAIGNSNWDYYYDEERNVIYYISKNLDAIMDSFVQEIIWNAI